MPPVRRDPEQKPTDLLWRKRTLESCHHLLEFGIFSLRKGQRTKQKNTLNNSKATAGGGRGRGGRVSVGETESLRWLSRCVSNFSHVNSRTASKPNISPKGATVTDHRCTRETNTGYREASKTARKQIEVYQAQVTNLARLVQVLDESQRLSQVVKQALYSLPALLDAHDLLLADSENKKRTNNPYERFWTATACITLLCISGSFTCSRRRTILFFQRCGSLLNTSTNNVSNCSTRTKLAKFCCKRPIEEGAARLLTPTLSEE